MTMKPLARIAAVAGVTLAMLIPLAMIQNTVRERESRLHEAERSVAASLAGAQRLVGPLLVVNYTERTLVDQTDPQGRRDRRVVEQPGQAVFVAERLQFKAVAEVAPRQRGLFKVNTLQLQGRIVAQFAVPRHLGLGIDPRNLTIGGARLAWGLGDVRGLRGMPQVTWGGESLESAPGPGLARIGDGFHTPLPRFSADDDAVHEVRATLEVVGTETLTWVPVAKSNEVALQSSWPHPSFGGSFLPVSREISANGFTARWEVPYLASRNIEIVQQKAAENKEAGRHLEGIEVRFADPVNQYVLADRATKHGVLFVVLSIAGFFLLDVVKKRFVHPVQYAFVGLALAVFFLLLLALSEHLPFAWAYAIAAAACLALIGAYSLHALNGLRPAALFVGQLGLLYVGLFALLKSEDHALLLGALLSFAMLAATMLATRKVDWYAANQGLPASPRAGRDEAV